MQAQVFLCWWGEFAGKSIQCGAQEPARGVPYAWIMSEYPAAAAACPTARPVAQRFRHLALFLAGLLLAAGGLVTGSSAASAHDELSSSAPEAGAALEAVPEMIELTFTNVPATIGSDIQVLDESGEDWAEGEVSITDAVATQAVRDGAPAGNYTVNWRVVSADSHPIEGTFQFTATGGAASETPAAAETPAASESPRASAGTAGPIETAEPGALDQEPAAGSDVSWGVILMIAVLIALAIVLALGARRRLRQGDGGDAA
jgi:methionine-rich copper-binding protein CopC